MYLMNRFPHKRNTDVTVGQTIYRVGPGGFICDPDDDHTPLDVPDVDAERLLQGKAWSQLNWDPDDPDNANRFLTKADYPKGKGIGRPPRTMAQLRASYGLPEEPVKPLDRRDLGPQPIGVGVSKDGTGGLHAVEHVPPSDRHLMKSLDTDRGVQAKDLAEQRAKGTDESEFVPDALEASAEIGDGRRPSPVDVEDATPTTTVVPGDMPPAEYPQRPVAGQHWPDPSPDMEKSYLTDMADAYGVKYAKNISPKTLSARIHKAMYE